jgi:hypothetical protein
MRDRCGPLEWMHSDIPRMKAKMPDKQTAHRFNLAVTMTAGTAAKYRSSSSFPCPRRPTALTAPGGTGVAI